MSENNHQEFPAVRGSAVVIEDSREKSGQARVWLGCPGGHLSATEAHNLGMELIYRASNAPSED